MSVVQACADAEAVIRRARALFGTSGGADVPSGADQLTARRPRLRQRPATHQRDGRPGDSGLPRFRADAPCHRWPPPPAATPPGRADHHAAAAAAAGATRLDTLAAQIKTLAADAPSATTANQQRAILTALGTTPQVSQVVQTTQQQGDSTAAAVRDLTYPKDDPPRVVTAPFSRSTTARKRRRHMA